MQFFKNLKNSIYGPDYYTDLLQKSASHSFKYYFTFVSLVALIAAIVVSFTIVPGLKSFFNEAVNKALNHYPAELVVTIKDGKVSTNVQEPYVIKTPESFDDKKVSPREENLLVIDTKNVFSLEKFNSYKATCLLTQSDIVCNENGQIRIQSLGQVSNFTIDKSTVASWLGKAQSILRFIYPVVFIGVWIAYFFVITARLVYLFVFALLIWLVASLKKIKMGYLKSYQLGLHLMTAATIITFLLKFLFPKLDIPYLFTLITLIFTVVNLKAVNAISVVDNQTKAISEKI